MQTRLLSDPSFRLHPGDEKNVELVGNLRFSVNGHVAAIPSGFRFDGASAPRAVRWIFDSDDGGYRPPCVHDILYKYRGEYQGLDLSRAQVDRIFLLHMKQDGVPRWKRWAAYAAVRIGGLTRWID